MRTNEGAMKAAGDTGSTIERNKANVMAFYRHLHTAQSDGG